MPKYLNMSAHVTIDADELLGVNGVLTDKQDAPQDIEKILQMFLQYEKEINSINNIESSKITSSNT